MARKIRDQASNRRSARVRDQHGRQWGVTLDISTMAPVGTPVWVGWSPQRLPDGRFLMPPQKYMTFDPEELGETVIDYEGWISELEIAHTSWERQLASMAQGMYGDKAVEAIDNPPPALVSLIGPRPFPIELVEACRDEDPWALGLPGGEGKGGRMIPPKPPASLAPVLKSMAPLSRRRAAAAEPAAAET